MKKIIFLFVVLLSLSLGSCTWTEPYEEDEYETNSDLVLKSGSFSSDAGEVYIQANLKTWLSLTSQSGKEIKTAVWKIEGATYSGSEIVYQTSQLGKISCEVEANFADGTSTKKTFTVISVVDLNETDPVRVFLTSSDGKKGQVTILFSKERVSESKKNEFFYNGSVTNWTIKKIIETEYNYSVISGKPEKVSDGQYIAVKLEIEVGEHSIALVYGDNIWANLSGSKFIRKAENPGLAYFYFNGDKVVALGDGQYLHPGKAGDMYFRFSNNGNGTATFFFKFNEEVTSSSFVTKKNADETYSSPIAVTKVNDFPEWGSYNVSLSTISGTIVYFRYGANKNSPTSYSPNMKLSGFYNEVYNALRLSAAEI